MNQVNFTLKTRRSLPDGVSERKVYACRSFEISHDLNDNITLVARGLSGTNENAVMRLRSHDHPSKENYEELILENMAGKTTERFVASPSIDVDLRNSQKDADRLQLNS
tara:strand:- start:103287 stop:103613 length:327 start_codon:yes stop_codon:yes gene_type:complete